MAFAVYGQVVHGADINAQVRSLNQQNAVLQQQISDRQKEISQAQSSAWLEEQARMLGYVLPGEKVYVLTSPGATPPAGGGGVNAALPTFSPSPTPTPTPSPSSAPSVAATPTPFTLNLAVPTPH